MLSPDILSLLSPRISHFVEVLLRDGRVGICAGNLRVADVGSGCCTLDKQPNADRFKIVMPYAGCSVTWEVLFNGQYPDEPPDFIFAPEDADFLPDIDVVPSLVNWSSDDPGALLKVLQELLQEYRKYQSRMIDQNSRLQFEYSSLTEHGEYRPEEIEVHITKKGERRLGPINFLIKLPIDFSKIPSYLTKDNPGEDTAVVVVTFQAPEGGKVIPQMYLSPRVEHALGDMSVLRIPPFPNCGCLIDYLPTVCELLKNKVNQVVACYERRKEYVGAFLSHYGRSVLEYDVESFTKISFVMEWHDFFFVIIVDIPEVFPIQKPSIWFQSIYHDGQDGRPYIQMTDEYPYSPRWGANEMAERMRAYILEYIPKFQRGSVTQGVARS